jgi:hypothetical protein
MKVINIARQFSEFPTGRFYTDGPDSGQRFRDEHLLTPLSQGDTVKVELSGTDGYGSSFLDEAFGGVVRILRFSSAEAAARILFEVSDPSDQTFINETRGYIADACAAVARQ